MMMAIGLFALATICVGIGWGLIVLIPKWAQEPGSARYYSAREIIDEWGGERAIKQTGALVALIGFFLLLCGLYVMKTLPLLM